MGIILFLIGIIAIVKEHIPLVLSFSVAMILYLLLFMYSRVITSPGLIILRTFILLLLSIESFCFCIMIRDWRAIQVSRLNQRLMKEAQMAQYHAANGMMMHNVNISGYSAGAGPSYAYNSAAGGQLMSGRQMMFAQQQHHLGRSGYPDEMRPYQTPILGRSGPYGVPAHPMMAGSTSANQQHFSRQHQHQQMSASGPYGRAGGAIGNVYSQQQQHQYGQQYDLNNVNPYITIEDENPYAQIGEPTTRDRRGHNQSQGHVYTTQNRASQPRRY